MEYADPELARRLATGWFATVDPGVRYPAAAVWNRGTLVAASRVKLPGALAKLGRTERCRQIGKLVADWIRSIARGPLLAVGAEWPQVYPHGKGKGSPNLLLPLAGVDVAVACELGVEALDYLPREWIGTIPKCETGDPWSSPRGRITKSRLRDEELAVVVASHDAVDAVALGLKYLGRLERVLPGTT